jgi:hypothetical protein
VGKGTRQRFVIPRAAATQEKEAKSWQRQKKRRKKLVVYGLRQAENDSGGKSTMSHSCDSCVTQETEDQKC